MNLTIVFFITTGLLVLCDTLLREYEIGSDGTLGRSTAAHQVTVVLGLCVVVTGYLTLMRLADAL